MSSLGDERLKAILDCLRAAQSQDTTIRQQAEHQISQAEKQPGFGAGLTEVTVRKDIPEDLRQFGALLLKKYVKSHWDAGAPLFQEPVTSEEEKQHVRQALPAGLADPDSKIRTAVAMAVATVARTDVPEEWPSLVPDLVAAIASDSSPGGALVVGSVRCLSMFVDDLDEEQIVQMVPGLLPQLLTVVQRADRYEATVVRRAVAILRQAVHICMDAEGPYKVQARQVLLPHLEAWLHQFCTMLATSAASQEGVGLEESATLMEVLKTLVAIFSKLPKHVQGAAPTVLAQCCTLLDRCLPLYHRTKVLAGSDDDDDEQVDDDGDTLDFPAMISQLFEFFITLAGSSRFQPMLTSAVPQLIHLSIGYAQMTGEEERRWAGDVNEFVVDEDEEVFSVRSSACLLVEELLGAFPEAAAAGLNSSVARHFKEAADLKAKGDSNFWRAREACLLAVGSVPGESLSGPHTQFQVQQLLENVLHEDLASSDTPQFLFSRALWAAARLGEGVEESKMGPLLDAVTAGLEAQQRPVVQVGACGALKAVISDFPLQAVRPYLDRIYASLGKLLSSWKEEALHLALEALNGVVGKDGEAATRWEPHLTPPLLQIWAHNFSDPLIAIDTVDIFTSLASTPEALPALQQRVLPVLISLASKPQQNVPTVVEGALDLANALLTPSTPQAAAEVHAHFSGTVMALMRTQDDPGILQSCCEYLRILISIGGEDVFRYGGGDPEAALLETLGVLNRLLQPDMGDSAPLYVGQVLNMLMERSPENGVRGMPHILPALLAKLATARSSLLIVNLLAVCARLANLNASQFIDYLASAPSPSGQGSALDLLLQVWTERQLEFSGSNEIKLSTTALSSLLATRHQALNAVQVKGKRLDVETGIRTRSRAKQQEERWEYVPAPAKIFSLLADTLLEAKEGRIGEDDDSWESGSEGDLASLASDAPSVHSSCHLNCLKKALNNPNSRLGAEMREEGGMTSRSDATDAARAGGVELTEYVSQQFRSLAQQDKPLFESCCRLLNPHQLQAVQACF